MGSAQSLVSAAAVLAIVGAIAYGFARPGDPTASLSSPPAAQPPAASASSKKKQKKKAGNAAADAKQAPPVQPGVVSFPPVVPGDFDSPSEAAELPSAGGPPKASKKKKKGKKASSPVLQDAQSDSSATAPESSAAPARKQRKSTTPKPATTAPAEDDGWTKVQTKKKVPQKAQSAQGDAASSSAPERPLEISTSDAGITTSVTANSSPVTERTEDESRSLLADSTPSAPENRRTLAERLLPKPRKTGVEDLLEEPDHPQLARVMRIQPRPDERPAAGFSWADYEDVDDSRATADDADGEDDGGWGVVRSRRSRPKQPAAGQGQAPAPLKAPETLTKKQRQHAARREAEKAAKAQAEAERLATLAKHKRELEKARIAEQSKAAKKQVSGGMSAYVDESGKLVWQ
ncbi:hypothetical protein PYCCODRAFT_1432425 [Trametes coccinea BRFM310]|uniref:Uncharacterized protein n=1 Tax=Trametes coccinea (strain BRFM310) TaxID=1353009 RepID=A0A1Y2IVX5_TRAC3|nr:hypothetical protein PYCCODRAFT_1432425 [Trametes coccinea BRFM310]